MRIRPPLGFYLFEHQFTLYPAFRSVYAATPVASTIAVAITIASTIVMPFESPASFSSPPHHNVKVGPIALAGAHKRMHTTSFVMKSNGKNARVNMQNAIENSARAPRIIATFLSFARRRKANHKTEHKHGAKRIRIRNGLGKRDNLLRNLDIENRKYDQNEVRIERQ